MNNSVVKYVGKQLLLWVAVLGSVGFSLDVVVLTCRSLQRIAEHARNTEETSRCFHDVIIPRLLSLALQAALQGRRLPIPQHSVSLRIFSQLINIGFY